ncbi:MAG: CPBP family intramembrane glutamic endopeptidase [Bacteroidota bacterium]|nr:CPBP family intramembrane glutamic endopeptidase [Bacteroidota bacterium]
MSYLDKTLEWSNTRTLFSFIIITLASLVFFGGIGFSSVSSTYGLTTPAGMRWMQFSISLGLFLMPPLFFAQIVSNNPSRFLCLVFLPSYGNPIHTRKNGLKAPPLWHTYMSLALVCFGAFFAVDLLAQLNQLIVPDLPYFQKLKIQEEEVRKAIQTLLKQTSPRALIANFVVMVLVPALGEELFFRGILQKLFQRNFNLRFAVVATSLCFAVAHQQPLSFIPLFFMGVLLSYAKYWTGSLWAAILLHSINNSFALFSSYVAGGELQYESTMDISWSIAGITPLVIGIYWMSKIRQRHKEMQR